MIEKVDFSKKIFSLEFVDAKDEYHYVYFKDDNIYDLKNKVKEYRKNGTLTFISFEGAAATSQVFYPKYVRVSKVLEMYVRKEEEKENEHKDISA